MSLLRRLRSARIYSKVIRVSLSTNIVLAKHLPPAPPWMIKSYATKSFAERNRQNSQNVPHVPSQEESLIKQVAEIENKFKLYGYSTLRWGLAIIGCIGVAFYFSREEIRESVADEVSQVASRSLSDEALQQKAAEMTKELLNQLLNDQASQKLAVKFVGEILVDKSTVSSLESTLGELTKQTKFQKDIAALLTTAVIDTLNNEQFQNEATIFAANLLQTDVVWKATSALVMRLLNDPEILKQTSQLATDVLAQQNVQQEATRLAGIALGDVIADDDIQRHTGDAMWSAFLYSIKPTWFSGRETKKPEEPKKEEKKEESSQSIPVESVTMQPVMELSESKPKSKEILNEALNDVKSEKIYTEQTPTAIETSSINDEDEHSVTTNDTEKVISEHSDTNDTGQDMEADLHSMHRSTTDNSIENIPAESVNPFHDGLSSKSCMIPAPGPEDPATNDTEKEISEHSEANDTGQDMEADLHNMHRSPPEDLASCTNEQNQEISDETEFKESVISSHSSSTYIHDSSSSTGTKDNKQSREDEINQYLIIDDPTDTHKRLGDKEIKTFIIIDDTTNTNSPESSVLTKTEKDSHLDDHQIENYVKIDETTNSPSQDSLSITDTKDLTTSNEIEESITFDSSSSYDSSISSEHLIPVVGNGPLTASDISPVVFNV